MALQPSRLSPSQSPPGEPQVILKLFRTIK
jgi:hypothetical protein